MSNKKKPFDSVQESVDRLRRMMDSPLHRQMTSLRDQMTVLPRAARGITPAELDRATKGGITRDMIDKVMPTDTEPRSIPDIFRDAFPKTTDDELADELRNVQRRLDLMTQRIDELVTAMNRFTEAVTAASASAKRDRGELTLPKKPKKSGAN